MRKTRTVVVPQPAAGTENRDAGKRYLLTEMPAMQAEKWGVRAILALGTSGVVVPQEFANAGIFGVALVGYQAFMGSHFAAIEPLMDEMMACVDYLPSDVVRMPFSQFGVSAIEEVSTLLMIREQLMELHTGFTLAELALRLKDLVSAKMESTSPTT